MKTKCVIVDDEPLAIEIIENYLNKFEDMEIVTSCGDAMQAFEIIKSKPVDLMFLDIQMPQLTGIEFLKSVRNPPAVIITTAYRDYALQGYDLDVVDYLLKPISFERFMRAINKYFQYASSRMNLISAPDESGKWEERFIYVRADKKNCKILLKDILFIESLKDYVKIKTGGKTVVAKNTISYFEELLPPEQFIRIHRSYIISLSKIDAFTQATVEVGRDEFPIGKSYKNRVLKALNWHNKLY